MKKILLILLIFALAAIGAIVSGYYPALIVNGAVVWARQVRIDHAAALSSFDKAVATYASGTSVAAPTAESIDIAILGALVDRALVRAALRRYFDAHTLQNLIAQKIDPFSSASRAGGAIYGLDGAAFKDEILIPQAERDILASKLFLEGKEFGAWLGDAEKNARVGVFYPGLRWDGKSVAKN